MLLANPAGYVVSSGVLGNLEIRDNNGRAFELPGNDQSFSVAFPLCCLPANTDTFTSRSLLWRTMKFGPMHPIRSAIIIFVLSFDFAGLLQIEYWCVQCVFFIRIVT